MPVLTMLIGVLLAAGYARAQPAPDPSADHRAAILDGVKSIAAPGTPGTIAVWGEKAWPIVTGKGDGGVSVPVVACAEWGGGKGRVVLFSHTAFLEAEIAAAGDTGKLVANAVRWAAAKKPGDTVRIGVTGCGIGDYLGRIGLPAEELGAKWESKLADIDVLAIVRGIDDKNVPALAAFVQRGGGLVIAQTGWGWRQGSGDRGMPDAPFNKLLAAAGAGFTDDTAGRTGRSGFEAGAVPGEFVHGGRALAALIASGEKTHGSDPAIPAADRAQVFASAMAAARLLPASDREYRARLDALLTSGAADLVPTETKPLDDKHPLERFLLGWQIEQSRGGALPASKVKAHPAAREFPGALPPNTREVSRTIDVDPGIPGWKSLGLYAGAGQRLVIDVPQDATAMGLAIRIGCHTDTLWDHDKWKRAPEISMRERLDRPKVEIASAFGGLVYIEVPRERDGEGPDIVRVKITGAAEAPLFVLGETTPEQWRKTIRARPGPWAELATRKVIVTVPSDRIRELDDPEPVLRMWDAVLDAAADLAGRPRLRERPERYVADVQISAGYMHSGYPIMTHLDAAADMVSVEALKKGCWGLFHELGHNHQEGEWTFDGTVEVTCNLFTLYTLDTVCKVPWTEGHDAMKDRDRKVGVYIGKGAKFEEWKSDPFLALQMYAQLIEGFGWETFKKVFAEYRELPRDQRPRGDAAKRDEWLTRFSRAAGKNLGPFFEAWGVPTSEKARRSIEDLPEWMPAGFPPK